MWRDVILVIAFLLAAFAYFGLTPTRILRYATTAKGEISKRDPFQIAYLVLAISLSLFTVLAFIYKYGDWRAEILSYIFFFIILNCVLWLMTLVIVWRLSAKVFTIILSSISLLSFAGYNIVVDTSIWTKMSPVIGFCIGYGLGRLKRYIADKREKRSTHQQAR